ncbi:MAG TPA: FAD-binding protein, partial [Saprospiraceae bacterium]|nr:FAD-binding protein [Saprospiraceae bacterium]
MIRELEIKLLPAEAADPAVIRQRAIQKSGLNPSRIKDVRVLRRSIDARGSRPIVILRVDVFADEPYTPEPALLGLLRPVDTAPAVIIVGTGPGGYFAALELIEAGIKPILFDRGKDVRARRRDLRAIQQDGVVHPHSNYCFGEGGAGTYSDGKLYTRSHKRGDIHKALTLLVEHGATSEILVEAHPHIGSNKLPQIVANIRETILHYGGEVHFDSWVTDLILHQGRAVGVVVNDRDEHLAEAVILATGHSARDVYAMLHRRGVRLEAKPFALGVRIEHSQAFVDEMQYRQSPREEHLPAASYKLITQVNGRGVFSF